MMERSWNDVAVFLSDAKDVVDFTHWHARMLLRWPSWSFIYSNDVSPLKRGILNGNSQAGKRISRRFSKRRHARLASKFPEIICS